MVAGELLHDPYNLILTGVGGQGNVMTSRIVGAMLEAQGFSVTIGETFGASQRGGSVMSHLRISQGRSWSPQIPFGGAHMVVSMEPTEAIRVLKDYGNPGVKVITNTRPFYPVGAISGKLHYPSDEELRGSLGELTHRVWFLNATEEGVKLGAPVLGNIVMAGALAGVGEIPLPKAVFEGVFRDRFQGKFLGQNITAFGVGYAAVAV